MNSPTSQPYGETQGIYPPPPKKSTPVWVWILAAVAVLVLLAGIAVVGTGLFIYKTAKEAADHPTATLARLAALANPEMELMSVDEQTGKVTLKERETGKTFTVTVDDIKNGRLEISSDEGKVLLGNGGEVKAPSWVPLYPGMSRSSLMSAQTVESDIGTISILAKEDHSAVRAWYEEQLATGGFTVTSTIASGIGETQGGAITATRQDERQTVQVLFNTESGATRATVSYQLKK